MNTRTLVALVLAAFVASAHATADFEVWANRVLANPDYSGYTRAELRQIWLKHYGLPEEPPADDAALVVDAGKYLSGLLMVEELRKQWCTSHPPIGQTSQYSAEEARIAFILKNRANFKQELEAQRASMQRRAASFVREEMPRIAKAAPNLSAACMYFYGMVNGLTADAGRRLEIAEKQRK